MIKMKNILRLFVSLFLKLKYIRIKSRIDLFTELNFKTILHGYNKIGRSNISSSVIGRFSYLGNGCKLSNTVVGNFCSLGNNVKIIVPTHPSSVFVSTHPSFYSTLKQSGKTFVDKNCFKESLYCDEKNKITCIIENDVWIGDDVSIIGGCRIGNGAIIATGSVVVKNVEPYSIVGGVPAKIIRYRFDEKYRKFLDDFRWWEKDIAWLQKNHFYFRNIASLWEAFNMEN